MKKGWTTTEFIAIGSLGVLSLVLTLPASSLVALTGIPLAGGFINIFLDRTLDALAVLLVPKFGAATLKRTILGIVAIPTLLLGPPGFLPKILVSATSGLVIDIVYHLLRRVNQKLAISVSIALGAIWLAIALVFVGRMLNVPGINETAKIFLSPLVLLGTALVAGICGYFGWLIYQKIKDTAIVKRIQK